MQLPDDVLRIIRDFSRPLTRPDWRTLHRLLSEQLHFNVVERFSISNLALIHFVKYQTSDFIYRLDEDIISITTPKKRRYIKLNHYNFI
jgi:hypothetical protein